MINTNESKVRTPHSFSVSQNFLIKEHILRNRTSLHYTVTL